ncbi:MAG: hypothetical protein QOF78_641 [Phycisphaerales bacterium]|jgi:hypothetical protein|nr:hypothetical protein [Phycisphaerales bacterium]
MKRSRLILPFVLLVAGALLLIGCIYIPTFNKVSSGVDASKKVGHAGSRRPLRVGQATRADVERVLGPPKHVSADGTEVAYTWVVQHGVWLSVCFGSDEVTSMRGVLLKFDGDVLRGFYLETNPSRLRQWIRNNSTATPPWLLSNPRAQTPTTTTPPGPTYQTPPSP